MSSLSDKKREFRSLLINDEVLRTIHTLKECMFDTCDKYDRLILIEAHFNQILRRKHANTISYENLSLEEGRIREKLLEIINGLEETDYPLVDSRDGKKYGKAELAGNVWMTENLNFDVGEGCCFYGNNPENGGKFGRLYTLEAAKKACPPGWRLPTDDEWKILATSFGGYFDIETNIYIGDSSTGYTTLMEDGNSGFSAQMGGHRYSIDGSTYLFSKLGGHGFYWSAYNSNPTWFYFFDRSESRLYRYFVPKNWGLSCRCIKDG